MPDLEDEFRELQAMHDAEHRKEKLLDKPLPTFRSRCPHCERTFSDPEGTQMCPDCGQRTGVFFKPDEEAA